jgi:hypothetical protein
LEEHLDYLVAESEQDGFLGSLPLLQEVERHKSPLGRGIFGVIHLNGLELLIAIKVALEMLKQDHLLAYLLGVGEEVQVRHEVLSVPIARSLDVVKVEAVGVKDDLGGVVEEDAV